MKPMPILAEVTRPVPCSFRSHLRQGPIYVKPAATSSQTDDHRAWNERVTAEKAAKKLANARAFRLSKGGVS